MARIKKKLNTDLDEPVKRKKKSGEEEADFGGTFHVEVQESIPADEVTYSMGDIQVSDNEASDDEDFKKASAKVTTDAEEEDEDDWVDEDLNAKDEDIFLDMDDNFDIDNPYSDDNY